MRSYGKFTKAQCVAIHPFVEGKRVHDLGAGNLLLANQLLSQFKAQSVVAVDEYSNDYWGAIALSQRGARRKIELVKKSFKKFLSENTETVEVALVSWPDNSHMPGLLDLLKTVKTVIYLGKNTDGTICAWPGFYHDVSCREILAHVSDPKNVLTVYGPRRLNRRPLGEEIAGIDNQTTLYTYAEAEYKATLSNLVEA